jgi:glucokinase
LNQARTCDAHFHQIGALDRAVIGQDRVGNVRWNRVGRRRSGRSEPAEHRRLVGIVDAHSGDAACRRRIGVEATAWAVPELDPRRLATLQTGRGTKDGNLALVAAGTGLGEALVVREEGRFLVVATEGGHTDYAPRTDEEIELFRHLRARFGGHVSVERLLSGPGLTNIDDFLASREPGGAGTAAAAPSLGEASRDRAAEIAASALDGTSPRAARALRLFAAAYGAEAGSLALRCLARGGVYLGGGIAPKILPALQDGVFLEAFRDKGRFRDLLGSIPVRVILDDRAALIGAARIARALAEA